MTRTTRLCPLRLFIMAMETKPPLLAQTSRTRAASTLGTTRCSRSTAGPVGGPNPGISSQLSELRDVMRTEEPSFHSELAGDSALPGATITCRIQLAVDAVQNFHSVGILGARSCAARRNGARSAPWRCRSVLLPTRQKWCTRGVSCLRTRQTNRRRLVLSGSQVQLQCLSYIPVARLKDLYCTGSVFGLSGDLLEDFK